MQGFQRSRVKERKSTRILGLALGLILVSGFGAIPGAGAQDRALPGPADLSRAFIEVARQVKPAVVHIDVVERPRQSSGESGIRIPGLPPFGQPQPRRGSGSGVIISPDGYILTNNHVARSGAELTVRLSDGRELKATRVGADPETDLAVIRIDARDLPYARLGDSDSVEQGEWVLALGSPFGLQQTMTAGIISATGRELPPGAGGQFVNYLQTDAAINPGNSGGPLVNMQGDVIGINTLIISSTGRNEGIGFAIPSTLASRVYDQLVRDGSVTRGYLGVFLQEVTAPIARSLGLEKDQGALIGDLVDRTSPAAAAGLESGDVIVEFDGKPVQNVRQLMDLVANTPVGKEVEVKYYRNGRLHTSKIGLARRPSTEEVARTLEERDEEPQTALMLGVNVVSVTQSLARQHDLRRTSGAFITSIDPGSPAAQAGLRSRDVIHRLNRVPIRSREDLLRALEAAKGESEVVLQVERGGQMFFAIVSLPGQ